MTVQRSMLLWTGRTLPTTHLLWMASILLVSPLSSHMHVPEKDLKRMNVSGGLMRVSTEFKDTDDLIKDFTQALKLFNDYRNKN